MTAMRAPILIANDPGRAFRHWWQGQGVAKLAEAVPAHVAG
jgi:hypothetical protein